MLIHRNTMPSLTTDHSAPLAVHELIQLFTVNTVSSYMAVASAYAACIEEGLSIGSMYKYRVNLASSSVTGY